MEGYTQFNYTKLFTRIWNEQTANVSYGLLALSIIVLALIIHSICFYLRRVKKKHISVLDELLAIAVLGYICVIASITFFNREDGSRGTINTDTTVVRTVIKTLVDGVLGKNNLPFHKMLIVNLGDYYNIQASVYDLLNVLLFIPWGMVLAFANYKSSSLKRFIMPTIYSIITSGCIETTQLITGRGYFEVEDLITNIFGGMLGAFIAVVIMAIIGLFIRPRRKNGGKYGNKE